MKGPDGPGGPPHPVQRLEDAAADGDSPAFREHLRALERLKLFLADQSDLGTIFEQFRLLKVLGVILMERFSDVRVIDLDDRTKRLVADLPHPEAAARLMEANPAFIVHPMVAARVLMARDAAAQLAQHPQISSFYDTKHVPIREAADQWERILAAFAKRSSPPSGDGSAISPEHFKEEDERAIDGAEQLADLWKSVRNRRNPITTARELDQAYLDRTGCGSLQFADEIVAENIMIEKPRVRRAATLELARRFGWLSIPYTTADAEKAAETVKRIRNRMKHRAVAAAAERPDAEAIGRRGLEGVRKDYERMVAADSWPVLPAARAQEVDRLAAKHGVPAKAAAMVAKPYPAWKQALAKL